MNLLKFDQLGISYDKLIFFGNQNIALISIALSKVLFYIRCTKCVEKFLDRNYLKSMCFYDIYYVGGILWRN